MIVSLRQLLRAVVLAMVAVCTVTSACMGRDVPDFISTYDGGMATDVVVVTEGADKTDGKVRVLETWKGDLKKGDVVEMPALATITAADRKVVPSIFARRPRPMTWRQAISRTKRWLQGKEPLVRAQQVTGNRMVLFLKRTEDSDADGVHVRWLPAGIGIAPDIKLSIAWIEGGWCYFYSRYVNPGPVELHGPRMSEKELKARSLEAIARREYEEETLASAEKAVAATLGMDTAAERLAALAPFVKCAVNRARRVALQAVRKEGKAALPLFISVHKDTTLRCAVRREATEAMACAGAKAGPFLLGELEKKAAFWRETGPSLQQSWLKTDDIALENGETLRDRYEVTLSILAALARIDYPECVGTVREFRDFWLSLPQLGGDGSFSQMRETADEVLIRQQSAEAAGDRD